MINNIKFIINITIPSIKQISYGEQNLYSIAYFAITISKEKIISITSVLSNWKKKSLFIVENK